MIKVIAAIAGILFTAYTVVGTNENVDEIKRRAPDEVAARNWEILRYEGWQYGSFSNHGGKVWYHVQNKDNHNIQYRVFVTMWDGELQYTYGQPEKLERLQATIDFKTRG